MFGGVEELGCQPTQNDNHKTHPWMLKTGLTPEEVSLAGSLAGCSYVCLSVPMSEAQVACYCHSVLRLQALS